MQYSPFNSIHRAKYKSNWILRKLSESIFVAYRQQVYFCRIQTTVIFQIFPLGVPRPSGSFESTSIYARLELGFSIKNWEEDQVQ